MGIRDEIAAILNENVGNDFSRDLDNTNNYRIDSYKDETSKIYKKYCDKIIGILKYDYGINDSHILDSIYECLDNSKKFILNHGEKGMKDKSDEDISYINSVLSREYSDLLNDLSDNSSKREIFEKLGEKTDRIKNKVYLYNDENDNRKNDRIYYRISDNIETELHYDISRVLRRIENIDNSQVDYSVKNILFELRDDLNNAYKENVRNMSDSEIDSLMNKLSEVNYKVNQIEELGNERESNSKADEFIDDLKNKTNHENEIYESYRKRSEDEKLNKTQAEKELEDIASKFY